MGLKGSLSRKIDEVRFNRALTKARKEREQEQKTRFETSKERDRITELEERRKLQTLKERRRSLERETGSGVRGLLSSAQKTSRRFANRRPSQSSMASRQRDAAFSVAGFKPLKSARRSTKKKKRKRKTKTKKRISPYSVVYYR
jgi:hypothetical protein